MRVLIVGAGGLGVVIAGYLSRAGEDVTLFVKPAQARAFAVPEVRLTGIVDFTAPVQIACEASDLGAFDYLIVCVKGRDTRAALASLHGLAVDTVLSLQNGVEKDDVLAEIYGRPRVLGAVAFVSGELQRPGTVLHTAAANLFLGELDGGPSPRGERLAAVLAAAGIPSSCVADIRVREWGKLSFYLGLALVSAATRLDTVSLVFDPDLSRVSAGVALDAAAVAAAEGVALPLTERAHVDSIEAFARPIRDRGVVHYMSLTQDLMAGRPTELEATAGDVLARAARHGVEAPVLAACTDLVRGIERGGTARNPLPSC